MTSRSIDQINQALDDLITRVNLVDGNGLSQPSAGLAPALAAEIEGLRTTINQVALAMQGLVDEHAQQLAALQALVYRHFGLSGGS